MKLWATLCSLALTSCLAVVLAALPAHAPELEPEFLTLTIADWDTAKSAIVLGFTAKPGTGDGGERAKWTIVVSKLEVFDPDGNLITRLGPVHAPFLVRRDASRAPGDRVLLHDVEITWDPGEFRGEATIRVTAAIQNVAGHGVGRPTEADGAILVVTAADGPMP